MEGIIGWLVKQLADKRRVMIAVIAALRLLSDRFDLKLDDAAIQAFVTQGADLVMILLAVWSKIAANRAAAAAATPEPPAPAPKPK